MLLWYVVYIWCVIYDTLYNRYFSVIYTFDWVSKDHSHVDFCVGWVLSNEQEVGDSLVREWNWILWVVFETQFLFVGSLSWLLPWIFPLCFPSFCRTHFKFYKGTWAPSECTNVLITLQLVIQKLKIWVLLVRSLARPPSTSCSCSPCKTHVKFYKGTWAARPDDRSESQIFLVLQDLL